MNILLIDDDSLVTLSLKTILESNEDIRVTGIGECGRDAVRLFEKLKPDILLMDIRMADMNGIEAGLEILKAHPDAKILYLTTFSDDEYIVKALAMGAKGYILKQDYTAIAPALRSVLSGQNVFGQAVMEKLPSIMTSKAEKSGNNPMLSEKETELITLVAKGYNNKEIAEKIYLSEGTVRNYLSSLLEKLDLRDRTQLAVYYYTEMNK